MGQIRHFNNGKWTIYTSGEDLSSYTGGTPDTVYIGDDEGNSGNYTKVKADGTKVDLEPAGVGSRIYTATFTAAGGVLTPTVLENTIGQTVTFSRSTVGIWRINPFGEFLVDPNRIVCFANGKSQFQAFGTVRPMVYWQVGVGLRLLVTDGQGVQIDDFTEICSIEIKIYD